MQNLKTVAAASALVGGMAMFLVDTSRSPQVYDARVSEAPARLPNFNARPIPKRRLAESSRADETELVSYNVAPQLLAATATQQATAPAPGTAARTPTSFGLFTDKEATKPITDADSNEFKTAAQKLFLKVVFAEEDNKVPDGTLTIQIGKNGSVRETRIEIKDSKSKEQVVAVDLVGLEMKEAADVRLRWDPKGDGAEELPSQFSEPKQVWVDNVPPRVLSVRLIGETGGVGVLEIQFANNDLKKTTTNTSTNFLIHRTAGQQDFKAAHTSFTILDRTDDSFVVQLNLGSLITDLYQVEVTANITDRHGNSVAEPRKFTFNSTPEAASGAHVAFPEYVRRKERQPQDLFNPGDKVETRVARLFYTRDAHRVAQIINRNVKSYNQSGVDRAKLTAKNARETAEQAARDRQIKERDAIRAAEDRKSVV